MMVKCNIRWLVCRLMSGLQASISVHIAREYYYPEGRWGHNYPLFHRAVGEHRDRVNNLFFAFLFVLRAVVKAKDSLLKYDFGAGDERESAAIRRMIEELVSAKLQRETSSQIMHTEGNRIDFDDGSSQPALEQCRKGFDESLLFQVSDRFIAIIFLRLLLHSGICCPYLLEMIVVGT